MLTKAGKKVVLFDNGPDWQLTDLITSDIWGRRIKPAGPPVLLEGKNPFGYVSQAGWGVGGAALHYFANFPRYLPTDFKIKSEHNRAHDWPIAYEDVAPYYDKVAADLGVSGDAKAEETWRPAGEPYPMPPMKTFPNGEVWLKAAEANGMHFVPAAVGMNSTEFKGRAACIYDGWCHVGCPIGALANPVVTYLGEARKAGAEVRPFSTVTRVLTTAGRQPRHRRRILRREKAKTGAGGERRHPRRLVGAESAAAAQFGDRQASERACQQEPAGRQIHDDASHRRHLGAVRRGHHAAHGHGRRAIHVLRPLQQDELSGRVRQLLYRRRCGDEDQRLCQAPRPDLFGAELQTFMKRAARGITRITIFGEDQPQLENRIELASDKDEFGMPLGRLIHSFDDDGIALWNANFDQGMKIAKATNAKETWPGKGPVVPTSHLHGGAIMGTEPENSVTNSYGQTHEIPNLWMAGPCIFPSEGASNPTYTIFSVSLRGAEHLAQNWGTVAG